MSRALAVIALCAAVVGPGAGPAEAVRLGPFCLSLVPAQTFAPTIFFPPMTLEVFLDAEPYGQVFLGTARTVGVPDSPSFVSVQPAGRFARISIAGTAFGTPTFQKPAFTAAGEMDTQAAPPGGTIEITVTAPGAFMGPVGTVPASLFSIPCPSVDKE
jgi:hypothetical protein